MLDTNPMKLNRDSNSSGAFTSRELRPTASENRFSTSVKLRSLEGRMQTGTTTQISHGSYLNSSLLSRSASICIIDGKYPPLNPAKGSVPAMDLSLLKELCKEGKESSIVEEGKSLLPSFLKGGNKDGEFITAQKRMSGMYLKGLGSLKKHDGVKKKVNSSRARLSAMDLKEVHHEFKTMNSVNRDISVTMEPIANENSQKMTQLNKYMSRRSGSLDAGPMSNFEEEVLEQMNKRFLGFKQENEIKTIKPMQSERFVVSAREEAYFKLKIKGLRFPLKGKIENAGKNSNCVFELLVSATVTRPRRNNFDNRFVGKNFVIESVLKTEWLYFTLAAVADLDVNISIYPSTIRKVTDEDDETGNNIPIYLKESYKLGLLKKKNNKDKLYPCLNYTSEQMAEFIEEIKKIKAEKEEKCKRLAKGGRNIVSTNFRQVWALNKNYFLEKIQNLSRRRDESIDNVVEKKERIDYEDRIRRFFVLNKEELHHNMKQEIEQERSKQDKINKKSDKWLKILLRRVVIYELAQRIHKARADKLLLRIKNRKITIIQRAFRKHMGKLAESAFLRKVKNIREALSSGCMMRLKIVKKKAQRVLRDFLLEHALLKDVLDKGLKYVTYARKIQKKLKQFYFWRHFQKIVVLLMVEDMLSGIADDKKKEREKKKGNLKKKDSYNVKEREKVRTQFDNAMQINKDFRIFVANLYQKKVMKKYLKKYKQYNDNLINSANILNRKEEHHTEHVGTDIIPVQGSSPSLALNSHRSLASPGTKKKLLVLEPGRSKKSILMRSVSLMPAKNFEFQPKRIQENVKPTLRLLNRETLSAYLEDKFVSIVQKAKKTGPEANLSWLFE